MPKLLPALFAGLALISIGGRPQCAAAFALLDATVDENTLYLCNFYCMTSTYKNHDNIISALDLPGGGATSEGAYETGVVPFAGQHGASGSYELDANGEKGKVGLHLALSATSVGTGFITTAYGKFGTAEEANVTADAKLFASDTQYVHVGGSTRPVVVHASLHAEGILTASATLGQAVFTFSPYLSSNIHVIPSPSNYGTAERECEYIDHGLANCYGNAEKDLSTTIPITYTVTPGQAMLINYGLELTARAMPGAVDGGDSEGGNASGDANLLNTLSWGGISEVTDAATGDPVSGWTITSESGFDYSKAFVEPTTAVPEPASGTLLLSMLAGCCALRRRRSPASGHLAR